MSLSTAVVIFCSLGISRSPSAYLVFFPDLDPYASLGGRPRVSPFFRSEAELTSFVSYSHLLFPFLFHPLLALVVFASTLVSRFPEEDILASDGSGMGGQALSSVFFVGFLFHLIAVVLLHQFFSSLGFTSHLTLRHSKKRWVSASIFPGSRTLRPSPLRLKFNVFFSLFPLLNTLFGVRSLQEKLLR